MRLVAFVLSAVLLASAARSMLNFLGILTADTFYLAITFITLAMLVVGGMSAA